MKKAVIYINQFFGQIGGEDKADISPIIEAGGIGPALELSKGLDAEITHTVICGDNYMGTHTEDAVEKILHMLEKVDMDIFLAGPAFQAGRYGAACGTICNAVQEKFGIPALTSMHVENPGVEMYRRNMYIMKGGSSAAKMRKDIANMIRVANKILHTEELKSADEEGYFGRGIRRQIFQEDGKTASERMIEMLQKKLSGESYITELPIPKQELVPIAPAIKKIEEARIALITTGGIVPADNPDKIQSASATRWGRYLISDIEKLESGEYKTIHAGFDPSAADEDPNRIAPIDVLKKLEKEGVYGSLHPFFYSTVGTGTTQAEAQRMAGEMIPYLKEDHVDGVLLVST